MTGRQQPASTCCWCTLALDHVMTYGLTNTACSRFFVRLGANAAPSKPPTHDHAAEDSGPNELQHAALSGAAPTLKPEGLQGRHCSNPASTRRRLTRAVTCHHVATKLLTDGPQATQMVEVCLRCSWHVDAHQELSVDHHSNVANDIDGGDLSTTVLVVMSQSVITIDL